MKKLRVKSIFEIPILKIILDEFGNDYEISQPSNEQIKYFNLEHNNLSYDVEIRDMSNFEGISIVGSEEDVNKIVNKIQEHFPFSPAYVYDLDLYGIYLGKIIYVNRKKRYSIVKVNDENVFLKTSNYNKGDRIFLQIRRLPDDPTKYPIGSTNMLIQMDSLVLEKNENYVRVSKRLLQEERNKLFEIGTEIRPEGYGLILRTTASKKSIDELLHELNMAVSMLEDTIRKLKSMSLEQMDEHKTPIKKGKKVALIFFNRISKDKMNNILSNYTNTMDLYYSAKSFYPYFHYFLKLVKKHCTTIPRGTILELLKEEHYKENEKIYASIFNVPSLSWHNMFLGEMKWLNENTMECTYYQYTKNLFVKDVLLEPGDHVKTYINLNALNIIQVIYKKNETSPLILTSLISPVELHPEHLLFMDFGFTLKIKNNKIVSVMDAINSNVIDRNTQDFISDLIGLLKSRASQASLNDLNALFLNLDEIFPVS